MTISIDDIININVETSPASVVGQNFNVGLIIGNTQVGELAGKMTLFAGVNEMAEAGFATTSPEYKAATLYFAQSPAPKYVAIGLMVAQEEPLAALQKFRGSSIDWYAFTFTKGVALTQAQMTEIAQYVDAEKIPTAFFNLITDQATYVNTMKALQALKLKRTLSMYTSKDATATAAIMGYAMGANYEGATAYTLAYKTLAGLEPETELTTEQLKELLGANGNVYVLQGTYYSLFRQGEMANGVAFDDVLYLDMLVNGIRLAIMEQLINLPKVGQTPDGVDIIVTAITEPCEDMIKLGYIAPGVWNGKKVMSLEPGDFLSTGYQVLAGSIYEQSQADRDARKAPPIYVCVKTAGAIEFVTLGVIVNR